MGLGLSRRCRPRSLILSAIYPELAEGERSSRFCGLSLVTKQMFRLSLTPRTLLAFVGAGLAPPSWVSRGVVAAAF